MTVIWRQVSCIAVVSASLPAWCRGEWASLYKPDGLVVANSYLRTVPPTNSMVTTTTLFLVSTDLTLLYAL